MIICSRATRPFPGNTFRTVTTNSMENATEVDLESELTKSFLALEKIDVNIFRASAASLWKFVGARRVFGGQVVGQAMVAACNTVPEQHHIHSLHCYFLRGGNIKKPILYHVDRTREGKTYDSRSVKATQESVPIFTMQTSFKVEEQDPYHYQMKMPDVPQPEDLLDARDVLRLHLSAKDATMSDDERNRVNRLLEQKLHVEIKPINPEAYFRQKPSEPKRLFWMKAVGKIGEDLKVHQCVAGFLSDFSLLGAATQPGGPEFKYGFMTSLDHSMWFHKPFHVNEWMLYEIESPQCGDGKALCLGRLWRQDGVLAVSVAQEGVIRTMKQSQSKL